MRKSDTLFFLTGAAALVYQTVWIRLLTRLLGSDASGLALVLAIFMGGMALGASLFGSATRKSKSPVRLFAAIEAGLGVWAALTAFGFTLIDPVESTGLRVALAVIFLLPPTLAMGATFPLMGRLTIKSAGDTGSEVSAFYGANTLGAAFGALLGPLVLMPWLGLSWSLAAAAGLDVLAAWCALRWLRAEEPTDSPAQVKAVHPAPIFDGILVATFLVGLAGMGLEVVLSRILVTVTGSSVYAYAIVLTVFLAGIGIGSRQLVIRNGKSTWRATRQTLSRAAFLLPALTLAGLGALRWQLGESDVFGAMQNRMPAGAGVLQLWASHAVFAALALLPPALALGVALPSAAAAFSERHASVPKENALARVYSFNTAGALLGSLVAGFVLLPRLGPEGALYLLLAGAWLAGIFSMPQAKAWAAGSFLLTALLLTWIHVDAPERPWLYLASDAHATVSVEEATTPSDGRVRSLRVNGKVVATTAPVDLRLQRLLGHVPGLLHGEVKSALVIGMGTGMTAGSLLDLPQLERLDIFEIAASVPAATQQFAEWNGDLVNDPRSHVRQADGRHALATHNGTWDLITSDPIHPWTRGSSDLYSVEHFQQMAKHLAPGGVASQWLPLYQLSTLDVQTVIASWCEAFPRSSAWLTAYDLALVGSIDPLEGPLAVGAKFFTPRMAKNLAQAGIHSMGELSALQVADDSALRAYVKGIDPMRDDKPVLEFRAPLSFLGGYATEVLTWSGRSEFVKQLPPACQPRATEVRDLLTTFLDELPMGLSVAARRYGEALLALPPAPSSN